MNPAPDEPTEEPLDPEHAALLVKSRARAIGFSLVGIAAANVPLDVEFARYANAVENQLHGPIGYLADNQEARRRLDTADILFGAQSVVVVGARYDRSDEDHDPPLAQKIARYARGRDYHSHMRKRLRTLATFIRRLGAGVRARPILDTAPALERAWAARAGIGFIGKNGMVIAPGVGSYFLLGEVVTTLRLAADAAIEERCGRCTLCLQSCPTEAFVSPFVLDAGRCISTLTIEFQGPVPHELRDQTAGHLFGCDVCQEVCPYNLPDRAFPPFGASYRPDARWQDATLEDFARLGMPDGPALESLTIGTPLKRAGAIGLARTACLMLGRERDEGARGVLTVVARTHPSATVRDAATWALDRISEKMFTK